MTLGSTKVLDYRGGGEKGDRGLKNYGIIVLWLLEGSLILISWVVNLTLRRV